MEPCVLEKSHNDLREDVKEIKKDVKELLGLKYKIIGFVLAISTIISLAFGLLK